MNIITSLNLYIINLQTQLSNRLFNSWSVFYRQEIIGKI